MFCSSEGGVFLSIGTHLIPHPNKVFSFALLIFFYDAKWALLLLQLEHRISCSSVYFLKVEKGGEDAFFISSYKGGVIAVADGVSG